MNFYHQSIKSIIKDLRLKKMSGRDAFEKLKDLPYLDLRFAKLDTHRVIRRDFPEVIYAQGKSVGHIEKIVAKCLEKHLSVILTKADDELYLRLKAKYPQLKYENPAGIIFFQKNRPPLKKGFISVVTAGTSDIKVAEEAVVTLKIAGNRVRRFYDVGVAGIHRVLDKSRILNKSRAIIVAAGMEGALTSVVAGLVNKPVIAVPTSVGYGAGFEGVAPLLTMLNCCAPGVAVVNIDNGFGAAYFANMLAKSG